VDLAVPRDIEPEVTELGDVFLHTVDTLGAITRANGARRGGAVGEAETIVDRNVEEFARWLRTRAAVPHIRRIRTRAEHERQIEVARALKQLARGVDAAAVVEAMSVRLSGKLLHPAMRTLRSSSADEPAARDDVLANLFRRPG
jgi:glutamyl-tRNA reductase